MVKEAERQTFWEQCIPTDALLLRVTDAHRLVTRAVGTEWISRKALQRLAASGWGIGGPETPFRHYRFPRSDLIALLVTLEAGASTATEAPRMRQPTAGQATVEEPIAAESPSVVRAREKAPRRRPKRGSGEWQRNLFGDDI